MTFYEETRAFEQAIPSYAETLWETVFTTPDNRFVFTTTEADGDERTMTLNKDSTWTPPYLEKALPSRFHHELNDTIREPDRADKLDTQLDKVSETTWNSGRKTILSDNITEYGQFINAYDKVFNHVNMPNNAVAQILFESGFNPTAQSSYACGPGQIHRYHLRTMDDETLLPNCDNPLKNAELSAKIGKAQQLIYDETWYQSNSRYHSGFQNYELITGIGASQGNNDDEYHEFLTGLQTLLRNRNPSSHNTSVAPSQPRGPTPCSSRWQETCTTVFKTAWEPQTSMSSTLPRRIASANSQSEQDYQPSR